MRIDNISKSYNYTKKASDEFKTPDYMVKILFPYLNGDRTIWCPCDTKDSWYVKCFEKEGFKVIYSHIDYGQDFLTFEPDCKYDYIITNIPFSLKLAFLKRAYALNKKFAFLMPLPALNYEEIGNFFSNSFKHSIEFLIVDKKVSFNGSTSSFNSSYWCNGLLGYNRHQFVNLPDNNSGKFFRPDGSTELRDKLLIENKKQNLLF